MYHMQVVYTCLDCIWTELAGTGETSNWLNHNRKCSLRPCLWYMCMLSTLPRQVKTTRRVQCTFSIVLSTKSPAVPTLPTYFPFFCALCNLQSTGLWEASLSCATPSDLVFPCIFLEFRLYLKCRLLLVVSLW